MFPKVVYTDDVTVINAQNLNDIQDAIIQHDADIDGKTNPDGYYPDMTVGFAEQLVGTTYTEDNTPYRLRKSGGGVEVGAREYLDNLVGGSLGWNQLARFPNGASTIDGITYTVTNNNKVAISGTATANSILRGYTFGGIKNHVYYVGGGKSTNVYVTATSASNWTRIPVDYGGGSIGKMSNDARPDFAVVVASGATVNTSVNVIAHDLTQMFGSTIADYVYSLEQSSSGSGIAWLSKYIDLGTYHAYDAGSIQNVEATAHVTTGFNQWDGTYTAGSFISATNGSATGSNANYGYTDYIPIVGGQDYYLNIYSISTSVYGAAWYDGNKTFISGVAFTQGSTTKVGIITAPNGAVYMRTSIKLSDIGSTCINISKTTGSPKNGDYVPYNGHSYPLGSDTLRGIPQLVNNELKFDGDIKTPDGTITRRYGSRAYQSGDTTDGSTMITDGTTTVYKLTTPTTENSTSYQRIQTVDPDGTESFTVSSPVPVGHYTQYPKDLWSTLDKLADIFTPPTANGTYTLKVTVNNGVATYSWGT